MWENSRLRGGGAGVLVVFVVSYCMQYLKLVLEVCLGCCVVLV